jgi:tetratricopeptide (TPR) repeat protein/V8-like Glu-specific endopeptidase
MLSSKLTMKYSVIIGSGVTLLFWANSSVAKTNAEVKAIAQSTTVEIKLQTSNQTASGIIIRRQGSMYTLLTNRHVVCGSARIRHTYTCPKLPATESYSIKTSDGSRYVVQSKSIQLIGNDLDLAIIQFQSKRSHPLAAVSLESIKAGDLLYTSGFPTERPGFFFGEGKAMAVVNRRLAGDTGGYTMVYSAPTLPGMSGSGVFDRDGKLVAIHGQGVRVKENTLLEDRTVTGVNILAAFINEKIRTSRGIPIKIVMQGLNGSKTSPQEGAVASTADEYFIAGFNKYLAPGRDVLVGKRDAINHFNQAIKFNPKYAMAYLHRARVREQLQEYPEALADYNAAILIDPKYAAAYSGRGSLRSSRFNDMQGALSDYNQAIAIEPSFSLDYTSRGALKADKLKDPQGAMADFNQAIAVDTTESFLDQHYMRRGILKEEQNDFRGALGDFDRAITSNPKSSIAYIVRGTLKANKLNDYSGALADFDQAIVLDDQSAFAYMSRGTLKNDQLQNSAGALADFDQAIAIAPKFALAYASRGLLKYSQLQDYPGALTDFSQAINLDPKFSIAYNSRGTLRAYRLQDNQGALADFNQAVALEPQNAGFYINRGLFKGEKLNDRSGALADLDKSIIILESSGKELDPQNVLAHIGRGLLKYNKLADQPGGIADVRKAAKLARKINNQGLVTMATRTLKAWGVTE